MNFLDHLHRCNRWNPDDFLPFRQGAALLGYVNRGLARRLRDFPDLFSASDDGLALGDRWSTPLDRSNAMRPIAATLAEEGFIGRLRGEDYRVATEWGRAPVMVMDRAVVPAFGVRAFGIHVNGMARSADGVKLWIGKRAADKPVEPGKLDNMVAGGQPADLSLQANLLKEAAEEAGLSEAVARSARPVGVLTYCMQEGHGLRRDSLFIYDLAMPHGVVPRPHDGEMEGFSLMDLDSIVDLLRSGFSFKFNVALVLIDFLIRHGVLTADNEPDYVDLVTGLHTRLQPSTDFQEVP